MAKERVKRRLAAILSADVVGYTRLVKDDEVGTISALRNLRSSLVDPIIQEHSGRIVKLMGDGALVEFASVVDAVDCAVKIQKKVSTLRSRSRGRKQIMFRMGVNLGDVIIDGDDIYGDGVNIASRLEALAEPGGVCLSSIVKENLTRNLADKLTDRGYIHVKSLDEPIRVWAWSSETRRRSARPRETHPIAKPVIAVLPFDNIGGCATEDYLSEGISEDIITELSKFHSLSVLARHSSFAVAEQKLVIPEVGRRLNADYIVEGSVRRLGERVRLVAQLVEAKNGRHLWADYFDESFQAIFEIEDQIVARIVGMLESNLLQEELLHINRSAPTSATPYDLWLQARKLMESWSPEDDRKAEVLLQKAVSLDDQFARAHGGLAGIYNTRILLLPGTKDIDALLKLAFQHARSAVELDPNDGRNHIDLAWSYMLAGKPGRGEKHFQLARDQNPNDASILAASALGAAFLGDPAEGEKLAQRAMELNPLHPDYYLGNLAMIQFIGEKYEEALATIESAPKALPELSGWRAAAFANLDRMAEARAAAEEFRQSIAAIWAGDPPMTDKALVDWLLAVNSFARNADRQRLIGGLAKSGFAS
jgi:adenylate cyclase